MCIQQPHKLPVMALQPHLQRHSMAAMCGAPHPCRPPGRVLPAAGQQLRASTVCAAGRPGKDAVAIDPEFAVPEVGWMWDTSSRKAAATKASLKSANIKAKK